MIGRALAVSALLAGPAAAQCRQALVLALDVSGSVDAREYRLQLDGLAAALGAPEVRAALLSDPSHPVRIAVFEWSGPRDQRVLVDWTPITDDAVLQAIRDRLRATERVRSQPSTGIGQAVRLGFAMLEDQSGCWRLTLDVSGDGKDNAGARPREIEAPPGITVNGLVVGTPRPDTYSGRTAYLEDLAAYYTAEVIRGPDAFVALAVGFEDYQRAMERKLLRELQAVAIGLGPAPAPPALPPPVLSPPVLSPPVLSPTVLPPPVLAPPVLSATGARPAPGVGAPPGGPRPGQ